MTPDPSLRAGDADRDRTVAILREAFAEGRLTEAEFGERVDAANAAKTYADLAVLTTDLPNAGATPTAPIAPPVAYPPPAPVSSPSPVPPTPLPAPAPPAAPARAPDEDGRSLRAAWAAWAGVSVFVTVLWLLSVVTRGDGSIPGFWPIWVIGPWGAVMVMASITRSGRD